MTTELAVEIDINHPAVNVALIKRKQGGSFPVDLVHKVLMDAGVPDALIPKAPTLHTALQRAMKDACRGDTTRDVKVTGRKGTSVYTIVRTDKARLDRDHDDGKGVSDAELTGKIDFNDNGFTIKLTPQDHPSCAYIRDRVDHHQGQFSNVYDLGVWLGQVLIPYVGGVPTGSGDYFLPKGDGFDLVNRVRKAFMQVNGGTDFVRVYMLPQLSTFADTVDAITDSLLDETERVCREIQERLGDEQTPIKTRGLKTLTEKAHRLREMSDSFAKALGTAFTDIGTQLEVIENAIGIAEINIDANTN